MQIVFMRHGKTKGNLEGRYVGSTDEPILKSSEEELKQLRERDQTHLKMTTGVELVYCSPLKRCRQTAELVFEKQYLIWPGLEETNFGAFEYKNYEELNGNEDYQAWLDSGGMLAFPGGESGADFRSRSCLAFVECLMDAKIRGAKKIAVVAHGGTLMAILNEFVSEGTDFYSWQVKNGGGYLAEWDSDVSTLTVLRRWNSGAELL